jgi:ATP phosphoribosyltransferase
MINQREDIRIALPSKGLLAEPALELMARAGLRVHKPNPRQYQASIPSLPALTVIFQRPNDIVVSVREGSVDFGITGWDVFSEHCHKDDGHSNDGHPNDGHPNDGHPNDSAGRRRGRRLEQNGEDRAILPLHKRLGFGHCTLNAIVPESWEKVENMRDLKKHQERLKRPLRIATKFPNLSRKFFDQHRYPDAALITAEGTLEIAPTVGYADLIVDLISTGTTLRDNRLKPLNDGLILSSQACLVANRARLEQEPRVLAVARQLLEFIVAYLRASENLALFANMRGESPQAIAQKMFTKKVIRGLQGPTISPVITQQGDTWFAVNLIVRKDQLAQAISELREVGGSGVVVTPVTYIFEEEPQEYREMLEALRC